MQIDLLHEPTAGPCPYILRCRMVGSTIEAGFRSRDAANEARPEFARVSREAFRL